MRICIHYTAVSGLKQNAQLKPVNNYHRDKNWGTKANPWYQPKTSSLGWYVGYNYFIDVNGTLTNTRSHTEETMAQVGNNCDIPSRCGTLSVCLAGDFNKELPNDKQIKTLQDLIRKLENLPIVFHRDIQKNRTCPGKLFTNEYLDTVVLKTNIIKPDKEDQEKEQEILKLKRQISLLRSVIDKLLNIIRSFKKK